MNLKKLYTILGIIASITVIVTFSMNYLPPAVEPGFTSNLHPVLHSFKISPSSTSLNDGNFVVTYVISNPTNEKTVVYLGIIIRPTSTNLQYINTAEKHVEIPPGISKRTLVFDLKNIMNQDEQGNISNVDDVPTGSYDLALALWNGPPSADASFQFDHTMWKTSHFQIVH